MSGCSHGPVSTMPNSLSAPPAGETCEEFGCNKSATRRRQGETDSMGCEYIDLCDEHDAKHMEAIQADESMWPCDWCKQEAKLSPRRDYEEGSSGRVYQVCRPCIDKDNEYWRQQAEDRDYD